MEPKEGREKWLVLADRHLLGESATILRTIFWIVARKQ